MAEWSIAAVLKTVVPKGTGGSNPSFSAESLGQTAVRIMCSNSSNVCQIILSIYFKSIFLLKLSLRSGLSSYHGFKGKEKN